MTDTFDVTVKLKRPPEGMEWQIREPVPQREYYAGKMVTIEAVLRPIVPATVMVEIRGELAERVRATKLTTLPSDDELELRGAIMMGLANARAAIARKPDSRCGYMYSSHGNDWHTNCPDCRGSGCTRCIKSLGHEDPHADRKPCPVMVCPGCGLATDNGERLCNVGNEGHKGDHA